MARTDKTERSFDFQQNTQCVRIHDRKNNMLNVTIGIDTYQINTFHGPLENSAPIRTIYGIIGMIETGIGKYLVLITDCHTVGELLGHDIYQLNAYEIIPLFSHGDLDKVENDDVDRLLFLRSVLDRNNFYFSYTYDITNSMSRMDGLLTYDTEVIDQRFVWNKYLSETISNEETNHFIVPIMMGYIQIEYTQYQDQFDAQILIISRRSTSRVGTRYWVRGIDKDGNVANFVETEQIFVVDSTVSSFTQIRGSIPLYWSQFPSLKYNPTLDIKPIHESLGPARAHFDELKFHYGSVTNISLINSHGSQGKLNVVYDSLVKALNDDSLSFIHFDFHHETTGLKYENINKLVDSLDKHYGTTMFKNGQKLCQQTGIFRTNCMDNLDRTNVVQSAIGKYFLNLELEKLIPNSNLDQDIAFSLLFRNIWANNGDEIADQYAGTGALKSDYTRNGVRTIMGALNDGKLSMTRYYKNNFEDGLKQDALTWFVGEHPKKNLAPKKNTRVPRIIAGVVLLFLLYLATNVYSLEHPYLYKMFFVLGYLLLLLIAKTAFSVMGKTMIDSPRYH